MEDEYPNKLEKEDTPETFGETDTPHYGISIGSEYFLNDEEKKEGTLNFLPENFNQISYEEIVNSFYLFLESESLSDEIKQLKPGNFECEFIRYFNGEGWIFLSMNKSISLNDKININNLKIMIKATLYSDIEYNIIKKSNDILKEIDYTYKEMLEKNLDNSYSDAPLNLVVLTSNPLMDGIKELRTLNEFNIITSTIFNLFEDEDYLKYTEFGPLTMETLKNIISNKAKMPVILHLICKST